MTTHILNPKTRNTGELVRLVNGEPRVRWDGDRTEYTCSWRGLEVTDSTDYLIPRGRFEHELWVSENGDVWRRKVIATAYPCEPGFEHLVGRRGDGVSLCWYCSQSSDTLEPTEFFVLVSAAGFPADPGVRRFRADCTSRPQQRAEVEEYAGELMRVGSVESRARAQALPTPDGAGCPGLLLGLLLLACGVVGVAGRILYGVAFE
jgi:hypothetical protein